MFTAAVGFFYFLLPVRWLTRIPVAVIYAIGIYALLLTENIYNVAVNRTIALLRAAHSVGFLLTLVTFFLLEQTVLISRQSMIWNILLTGVIAFPLALQLFWATRLEEGIPRKIVVLSLVSTAALLQLVWVLSYWPVNTTITALFLTTVFYSTAGMSQQYLMDKLYKRTLYEFASLVILVLCIMLFSTKWRGGL
jgi:hypothetical protein